MGDRGTYLAPRFRRTVAPEVAGSNPVTHPNFLANLEKN